MAFFGHPLHANAKNLHHTNQGFVFPSVTGSSIRFGIPKCGRAGMKACTLLFHQTFGEKVLRREVGVFGEGKVVLQGGSKKKGGGGGELSLHKNVYISRVEWSVQR